MDNSIFLLIISDLLELSVVFPMLYYCHV